MVDVLALATVNSISSQESTDIASKIKMLPTIPTTTDREAKITKGEGIADDQERNSYPVMLLCIIFKWTDDY
jgi:hypothetical protein